MAYTQKGKEKENKDTLCFNETNQIISKLRIDLKEIELLKNQLGGNGSSIDDKLLDHIIEDIIDYWHDSGNKVIELNDAQFQKLILIAKDNSRINQSNISIEEWLFLLISTNITLRRP